MLALSLSIEIPFPFKRSLPMWWRSKPDPMVAVQRNLNKL
jgi:hypothetical protein